MLPSGISFLSSLILFLCLVLAGFIINEGKILCASSQDDEGAFASSQCVLCDTNNIVEEEEEG